MLGTLPIIVRATAVATLGLAACAMAMHANAQTISVGGGAQIDLGSGSISAGCGDIEVSGGELRMGAGSIEDARDIMVSGGTFKGDDGSVGLTRAWDNHGTFIAENSSVTISDGCGSGEAQIRGNSAFADFTAETNSGRPLVVESGSTQVFGSSLHLSGEPTLKLAVRASKTGEPASFVLAESADQAVEGVDVADNDATFGQTIAPGEPEEFLSANSGNVANWFTVSSPSAITGTGGTTGTGSTAPSGSTSGSGTTHPVPALPLPMLGLLIGLVALIARRASIFSNAFASGR